MKIATKILVIVGGVVVVAAIGVNSKKGQERPGSNVVTDPAQVKRITCDRYIVAVQQRAVQCINQGYAITSSWGGIQGYEEAQMRACMMTKYSWEQSGALTADCTRAIGRVSCTEFNSSPWLDGPPCN